jgi:guanylate kinase
MKNNLIFITITGESAAGKSYLLDSLVKFGVVNKIISYTTRQPRVGEIEGKDYYFLTTEQFKSQMNNNNFVEVVNYNGTYYGTTNDEILNKVSYDKPGAIIVEPNGVTLYKQYCKNNELKMLKIFVYTPKSIRMNRLIERFISELNKNDDKNKVFCQIINRLKSVFTEEIKWIQEHEYDLIVPGTDIDMAMSMIKNSIFKMKG